MHFNYDELCKEQKKKFGMRHVQIILVFLCLTLSVTMRINLSVAIVAMTDNSTSSNPNIPTYNWTNTSVILSSFFWGYMVLQVVAGYLAKTYGPKYLLLIAFFVNTVACLLTPVGAIFLESIGVIILRTIQGLAQGCLFPGAHTVLGRWAPAEERSLLGIIVYSGISCGSVFSLIVTGFLCSSWVGWPGSFYVFGALGLVWCAMYAKLGYDNPGCHPSISEKERDYIEISLGQYQTTERLSIPWKSILTSIHFWAIVSANLGGAWGYAMMMTQIPTFLAKVMKFNIESNGVVSAVPYIVGMIAGFVFAHLADLMISKNILTRVNARKTFQLFGSYGQLIHLMLLAYCTRTKLASVVFLSLVNAHYSSTLVGYAVNHVDLSPRFAGIMQGISNAMCQTAAMFSPLIVQFIVTDLNSAKQWAIIFIITCVFYFVCGTFYAVFASATRQKWDGPESSESILETTRRHTIQTIHSMVGFEPNFILLE